VQGAVALHIEETWVRPVLDEYVHDPDEAVARGPMKGCAPYGSADGVDFRSLLEEVCACLGFAVDRSPMQWRDIVLVLVRRARTTGFDQGSNPLGLSLLCRGEDIELLPSWPSFDLLHTARISMVRLHREQETHLGVARCVVGVVATGLGGPVLWGSVEDRRCYLVIYFDPFPHNRCCRICIIR